MARQAYKNVRVKAETYQELKEYLDKRCFMTPTKAIDMAIKDALIDDAYNTKWRPDFVGTTVEPVDPVEQLESSDELDVNSILETL